LTVINEKRRDKAREDNKNKKYTPLDLRFKKTRAFRKRLTKFELTRKTLRTQKRESNFRQRKFALAA
jgi:large subunit ribosomal protein L35e